MIKNIIAFEIIYLDSLIRQCLSSSDKKYIERSCIYFKNMDSYSLETSESYWMVQWAKSVITRRVKNRGCSYDSL